MPNRLTLRLATPAFLVSLLATPAVATSDFEAPPDGKCYTDRGSFDCDAGERCLANDDIDDPSGHGDCVEGAQEGGLFVTCTFASECEGGLCEGGVCTVPCDVGCPTGYTCDADAITGGLCVPDTCADDSACGEGMGCYATDAGNRCLTEGPASAETATDDEAAGCSATRAAPSAELGLFGLGLVFVAHRRRRQAPRRR